MDPNIEPSKTEEKVTRVSGPDSEQVVRTATSASPDVVAQETTTSSASNPADVMSHTKTVAPSATAAGRYTQKKRLFYAYQIIWYVLAFIEIVLAFRFVLKMLGANPNSGFADFIYSLSYAFAAPFLSLFNATQPTSGSVIEWSTLVAGVVYAIIAWGIVKILNLGKPVNAEQVEQTVDTQ